VQQGKQARYQVKNWVRSVHEGVRYSKIHIRYTIDTRKVAISGNSFSPEMSDKTVFAILVYYYRPYWSLKLNQCKA